VSAYSDAVLADSPAAYWRMGESAGTTLVDAMGTYNGTLVNTPSLSQPGLIDSDADTAIAFDLASAEHVTVAGMPNPGTGSFTAEFWVNVPSSQGGSTQTKTLIGRINLGASAGWNIFMAASTNRHLTATFYDGTDQVAVSTSVSPVATGVNHIVVRLDRHTDEATLWINDVLIDDVDASAIDSVNYTGHAGVIAGAFNSGSLHADRYFTGTLDEIALYNHALPDSRIHAHYEIGLGNVLTSDWVDKAAMSEARTYISKATFRLPAAGQSILLGGNESGGNTTSPRIYELSSDQWFNGVGNLPTSVLIPNIAFIDDESQVIFAPTSSTTWRSADPIVSFSSWASHTGNVSLSGSYDLASNTVDKVYFILKVGDDLEIYEWDYASNTETLLHTEANLGRTEASLEVIADKLFIIGGLDFNLDPTDKIGMYDINLDTYDDEWSFLPYPAWHLSSCVLAETGLIYVAGGLNLDYGTLDNVWRIDPATGDVIGMDPLPAPRVGHALVPINTGGGDGGIAVWGGSSDFLLDDWYDQNWYMELFAPVLPGPEANLLAYGYANVGPLLTDNDPPEIEADLRAYGYANVLGGTIIRQRVHRNDLPEGLEPFRGDHVLRATKVGSPEGSSQWFYPDWPGEIGEQPVIPLREADQGKPLRLRFRVASIEDPGTANFFVFLVVTRTGGNETGSAILWTGAPGDEWESGAWKEYTIELSGSSTDYADAALHVQFAYDTGPWEHIYFDGFEIDARDVPVDKAYPFSDDTTELPEDWFWFNQGEATYSEGGGVGTVAIPASGAGEQRGIQLLSPLYSYWTNGRWGVNFKLALDELPASVTEYGILIYDFGYLEDGIFRFRWTSDGTDGYRLTVNSGDDEASVAGAFDPAGVTFRFVQNADDTFDFSVLPASGDPEDWVTVANDFALGDWIWPTTVVAYAMTADAGEGLYEDDFPGSALSGDWSSFEAEGQTLDLEVVGGVVALEGGWIEGSIFDFVSGTRAVFDLAIASGDEVRQVQVGLGNTNGDAPGDVVWSYNGATQALSAVNYYGTPLVNEDIGTYDPIEHRYLSIRFDGLETVWETSPDASTWTEHAREAITWETAAGPLVFTVMNTSEDSAIPELSRVEVTSAAVNDPVTLLVDEVVVEYFAAGAGPM
jgi:hypothetical protein